MKNQLLIADADGSLSELYLTYFAAFGYSVRVAKRGVECLAALRETLPDVLVLDTERKWGGADGVLSVMDEEDGLSKIPIVLLSDADGNAAGDKAPESCQSASVGSSFRLKWPAPTPHSELNSTPTQPPVAVQVVERLLKPFQFKKLLESVGNGGRTPHTASIAHECEFVRRAESGREQRPHVSNS